MFKRTLIFALMTPILGVSAFACSIPTFGTPRFDATQNIFVGQVTGYVETGDLRGGADPAKVGSFATRTAGVVVKMAETFYTTKSDISAYEIYRLGVAPDCGKSGVSLDKVKEWYKVGDYVAVVMGESKNVLPARDEHLGRLELRYGKHDSITVLDKDERGCYVLNNEFEERLKLLPKPKH